MPAPRSSAVRDVEDVGAAVEFGDGVAAVVADSVNPARSTGPALFVGGWALAQLWLFWVAPLAGAVIGGCACKWLGGEVKLGEAVPRAPAE